MRHSATRRDAPKQMAFAGGNGPGGPMRKLFFIVTLSAILVLAPGSGRAAATAGDPGYRLGVGDHIRIKVFDWRSATGEAHEWSALTGTYDVGADGMIAIPLLGGIGASELTAAQLGETISAELQHRLNLAIRPQASIEILGYRPFYILGDVNKPGEYPYRPGLTMLQALSIAGGRYRVNDPALLLTSSGDLRVLRLQYNQLLARRARLQAEIDNSGAIAFPPELLRSQTDPNAGQLLRREQALFASHRDALTAQVTASNALKSILNDEITSLQQKMRNVDQELALLKQELSKTTSMVQQGLAIAPREYTLRETELETEGRRMDLDTAVLRAKEDIAKADQVIVELRNKTRSEIQADLADADQKLQETAARITTSMTIVGHEADRLNGAATGFADGPTACLILRPDGGQQKRIVADETTRIEPGDTIEVLRHGERPQPNPGLVAEDPPPPASTPRSTH
jgi:exopolysaccharide production protein ExoF